MEESLSGKYRKYIVLAAGVVLLIIIIAAVRSGGPDVLKQNEALEIMQISQEITQLKQIAAQNKENISSIAFALKFIAVAVVLNLLILCFLLFKMYVKKIEIPAVKEEKTKHK